MVKRKREFRLSLGLFLLTFLTSTFSYSFFHTGKLPGIEELKEGIAFSLPLMIILLTHELGHYITAQIHGLEVSLPFFIPAPNLFGTFGAIILMRGRIPHRTSILETGAMGPIAGFAVALLFYLYGLSHSRLVPLTPESMGLRLGDPLIAQILVHLLYGPLPPGTDLLLHPVAYAGWVGFFVTSLNLLPIGQLDGGHVLFGLFPREFPVLARIGLALLILLGHLSWFGWTIWAILLLFVGFLHPYPLYMERRLKLRTRIIAWIAIAIMILTFIPKPL